jgi:hypothetical protein
VSGVGNTEPRAKQRVAKNAERSKKGREPKKGKKSKKKKRQMKMDIKIWFIICIEMLTFSFMGHRNVKCMHSFVKT